MLTCLSQEKSLVYAGFVAQAHECGLRRLRLFTTAVSRRVIHLVDEAILQLVLETAEAVAEGTQSQEELVKLACHRRIKQHRDVFDKMEPFLDCENATLFSAKVLAETTVAGLAWWLHPWWSILGMAAMALKGENAPFEFHRQADLLRDIFGNPFRPIALAPVHRTLTVVSLAHAAYAERELPWRKLERLVNWWHTCVGLARMFAVATLSIFASA